MDQHTVQLYILYLVSLLIAIFVGSTTQLTSSDPTLHMLALRCAVQSSQQGPFRHLIWKGMYCVTLQDTLLWIGRCNLLQWSHGAAAGGLSTLVHAYCKQRSHEEQPFRGLFEAVRVVLRQRIGGYCDGLRFWTLRYHAGFERSRSHGPHVTALVLGSECSHAAGIQCADNLLHSNCRVYVC
jgi:hypothetical protein